MTHLLLRNETLFNNTWPFHIHVLHSCPELYPLSPVSQARSRPFLSSQPTQADQSDAQQSRRRLFSNFSSSQSDRAEVRTRATSFGGAIPHPEGAPQQGGYTQRVVAFLGQPDIIEQLESRSGGELSRDVR